MTRLILLRAAIIVVAALLLLGGLVDPKHGAAPDGRATHTVAEHVRGAGGLPSAGG